MAQRSIYIFFSTGRWNTRRLTCRQLWRIGRRRPRILWHTTLARLVPILTRSRLAHVSVGYDGAVLDPSMRGNKWWPFTAYTLAYPTLMYVVVVPVSRYIDLDRYPASQPKPAWPTVLRWVTRGRFQAEDCVAITIDCLRQGGVDAPPGLVSPKQLYNWLLSEGYHDVDLSNGTAGDHD